VSTEIAESAPLPTRRNRSLAIGGTFVLLCGLSAVAFVPNLAFVAVSMSFLGLFLAYMGFRPDPQGGYLFEVVIPISVITFLYFGLGTMYLVVVPEALDHPSLARYLLPAQALAAVGFLCFLVGYGWYFRTTAPSPVGRLVPKSVFVYLVPAAMGTVGLSVQRLQDIGMMNDQGISASISFLQQFAHMFFFGWFLVWYMTLSKRLPRTVAVPLLLTLTAMLAVILYQTFGGKALALTLLGMPALAYYEVKRKLPLKAMFGVVLIFVFVIFPVYNTFRRIDRNLGTSRRVDRTLELASSWNSDKYMDASVFALLKRLTVVVSVAAILSDTGRWVDYGYGKSLILTPITILIPRFLWPEKPNIGTGQEFAETFRLKGAMDRETYIAISMVGDFYWNFALPGVIVGMWLLGMGYRWYYQRYGAGTGFDPIRKAMYIALLPTSIGVEGNVAIVVGGFIKLLVILVVFLAIAKRIGWLEELPAGSDAPAAR
jgi:hypothetical protein